MVSLHRPSRARRVRLIGVAVVVASVVLGVAVIRAVKHVMPSAHLTACGVDANGPYAKYSVRHEQAYVGFTYKGYWYSGGVSGSTAAMTRGPWPPYAIKTGWVAGKMTWIHVPGRVVGGQWVNTGKDLPPKLKRHFRAIVEPDDKSLIGCELYTLPSEGD